MDPFSGFSTIVALAADFVSQRRAEEDASLEEFKAWLANQRHSDIIKLLESNTATSVGIKALLHESHSETLSRLEQLMLQTARPSDRLDQPKSQFKADVVEKITLGINNSFVGTVHDISDLATRCAIYVIEEKRVEFQIELQKTVLEAPPNDPLILPKFEKARLRLSEQLKKRLEILTSQDVHEWWRYFLSSKSDWTFVTKSLIARADLASNGIVTGQKIDVWRTDGPQLSAPIYLSKQETAEMLEHLGFESTRDLCFGPYWRAAVDLPLDLIVRHVIPSIVIQLERQDVPASGDVLNLAAWHIGEG